MESSSFFQQLSSLENKTNCKLCLRETGIKSQLSTNQPQFNLQDICNIYLVYLKPNLSKTLPTFEWSSLETKSINTSSEFCSSCFTAGQKLLTMNEKLKTIQSEIDCFIEILSEEIIKFRRGTNILRGSDFFSPENIDSNETSSSEGQFFCESIKKEPEVKQESENEYVNLLSVEEENLYFSDNSSTCENQQDCDPSMDEPYSQQDNIDLDNIAFQNSKTSIPNGTPPTYERITANKVVSRKSIENRQLVICLERVAITPSIKKRMKSNGKSKMRNRKQTHLDKYSDPVSSSPKQKALEKTPKTLFQLEATSELEKEMKMEANSDSGLYPDIKKRLKKGKEKEERKIVKDHFQCSPCGMEFLDSKMYMRHLEALHGDEPVSCYKCGEEFLRHRWLRRHMEIAHPAVLKCENCPSIPEFKNIYDYEIHLMSHTDEIPYKCHDCHEIFSNPKTYCEHQKTSFCATRLEKFKCDSCDKVFAAKCFLLMHLAAGHKIAKQNSDDRFECDLCENTNFYSLLEFQSHYSKHTDEYIYSCDICGRGHRSLETIIAHRKTHLGQNYICQLCGKQFKMKYYLTNHIQVMHVEENVSCEICGHAFKNPRKFKFHLRYCGKSFSCEICGKNLKKSATLKKHMVIHTNKGLKCHICDKIFTTKDRLKEHKQSVHLKKRDFVCELCGKTFYFKQAYEQHIRIHNDEKAFECQICAEKFKYPYQLSEHNRMCHDAPLLQCKYCDAQFKSHKKKYNHYNAVHKDVHIKSFKCSTCDMCFDSRVTRSNHRVEAHGVLRKHTNKKCHICGKVIAFNLKRHLLLHERDKDGSFQCDLCDRRFLKEQSLRIHKAKDHKPNKQNVNHLY